MAIDSRAKRASLAGFTLPFLLGVTPDATKPQDWRQAVGWNYYGAPIAVTVPSTPGPRPVLSGRGISVRFTGEGTRTRLTGRGISVRLGRPT